MRKNSFFEANFWHFRSVVSGRQPYSGMRHAVVLVSMFAILWLLRSSIHLHSFLFNTFLWKRTFWFFFVFRSTSPFFRTWSRYSALAPELKKNEWKSPSFGSVGPRYSRSGASQRNGFILVHLNRIHPLKMETRRLFWCRDRLRCNGCSVESAKLSVNGDVLQMPDADRCWQRAVVAPFAEPMKSRLPDDFLAHLGRGRVCDAVLVGVRHALSSRVKSKMHPYLLNYAQKSLGFH